MKMFYLTLIIASNAIIASLPIEDFNIKGGSMVLTTLSLLFIYSIKENERDNTTHKEEMVKLILETRATIKENMEKEALKKQKRGGK